MCFVSLPCLHVECYVQRANGREESSWRFSQSDRPFHRFVRHSVRSQGRSYLEGELGFLKLQQMLPKYGNTSTGILCVNRAQIIAAGVWGRVSIPAPSRARHRQVRQRGAAQEGNTRGNTRGSTGGRSNRARHRGAATERGPGGQHRGRGTRGHGSAGKPPAALRARQRGVTVPESSRGLTAMAQRQGMAGSPRALTGAARRGRQRRAWKRQEAPASLRARHCGRDTVGAAPGVAPEKRCQSTPGGNTPRPYGRGTSAAWGEAREMLRGTRGGGPARGQHRREAPEGCTKKPHGLTAAVPPKSSRNL